MNIKLFVSSVIFFILPVTAFASEKGEGISLLPGYLNLAIFLILLPLVLKGLLNFNLFTYFKDRKKQVSRDIEESLKEKEKVTQTFETLKTKMDKISEEMDEMAKDASEYGERIKKEVLEAAKQRAEFLIGEGRLMVEKETLEAKRHLKNKLKDLCALKTEEKIMKKLGKKEQSELIDSGIKQLEAM